MTILPVFDKKSIEVEKTKIVFQFTLMTVASAIAGMCFPRLLTSNAIGNITGNTVKYFNTHLIGSEVINEFLRLSLVDVTCILILFIFSFSFINYVVSDLTLIFISFRFGINAAVIKLASFELVGVGASLCFWLLKGIALPAFLIFCCRMATHSLQLRRFSSSNGRMIINKKATGAMLTITLTMLGTVLIINGLYCLFLYIF